MIEKKYIGFYLFAFTLALPLPLIFTAITLGIAILNTLFINKSFTKPSYNWIIICLSYVLIDFVRSFIFEKFSFTGIDETKLAFIGVPIFFLFIKNHLNEQKQNFLRFFVLGVISYVFFAIIYTIYFYIRYSKGYTFSFTDHYVIYMLYNYLPGAYHHTYIGIYLAFSVLILVDELRGLNKINNKIITVILLFILFAMQFYLGSKMTMVLSIVGLLFYFSVTIIDKKLLSFISIIIVSFSCFLFFLIKDWLAYSLKNSFSYRLDYLKESMLIISDNYLSGIGLNNIKNYQVLINGELKNLIPHNLYVHDFLSNGIIGLILILVLFFYLFKKATVNKDVLFFAFILICSLLGLTEDFLYLQRGVFFFVFFTTLFLYSKNKINEK